MLHSPPAASHQTSSSRLSQKYRSYSPDAPGFGFGDQFTIADAAIPHEVLFQSERFVRQQKYFANISSRQSFKNSFHSVRVSLVRAGWLLRHKVRIPRANREGLFTIL